MCTLICFAACVSVYRFEAKQKKLYIFDTDLIRFILYYPSDRSNNVQRRTSSCIWIILFECMTCMLHSSPMCVAVLHFSLLVQFNRLGQWSRLLLQFIVVFFYHRQFCATAVVVVHSRPAEFQFFFLASLPFVIYCISRHTSSNAKQYNCLYAEIKKLIFYLSRLQQYSRLNLRISCLMYAHGHIKTAAMATNSKGFLANSALFYLFFCCCCVHVDACSFSATTSCIFVNQNKILHIERRQQLRCYCPFRNAKCKMQFNSENVMSKVWCSFVRVLFFFFFSLSRICFGRKIIVYIRTLTYLERMKEKKIIKYTYIGLHCSNATVFTCTLIVQP